jgi:hypothetical protein
MAKNDPGDIYPFTTSKAAIDRFIIIPISKINVYPILTTLSYF